MDRKNLKITLTLFAVATKVFAQTPAKPHDSVVLAVKPGQESLSANHPLILSDQVEKSNSLSYIRGFLQTPLFLVKQPNAAPKPDVKISTLEPWSFECGLCQKLTTPGSGQVNFVEGNQASQARLLKVSWILSPKSKWGNGSPITGNDFKLAWEIATTAPETSSLTIGYKAIAAVEVDAKNPLRMTFTYKTPSANFLQGGALFPVPSEIEGPVWKQSANDWMAYKAKTTFRSNPTNPGLYSGPFFPAASTVNLHTELKRGALNTTDQNPEKYPSKIMILVASTPEQFQSLLVHDQIDLIPEGQLPYDSWSALRTSLEAHTQNDLPTAAGFEFTAVPSLALEFIALNLRNPTLSDSQVRKALSALIDRRALSSKIFGSDRFAATNLVPPQSPLAQLLTTPEKIGSLKRPNTTSALNAKKNLPGNIVSSVTSNILSHTIGNNASNTPKDAAHSADKTEGEAETATPASAAALGLIASGWHRGKNESGPWERSGQLLSLELDAAENDSIRKQIVSSVEESWTKAGVDCHVAVSKPPVFFGELIRKARFRGAALFAVNLAPLEFPAVMFATRQIPTIQNGYVGQNTMGYSSHALDAAIDAYSKEYESDERANLEAKMYATIDTDAPVLPLLFRPDYAIVHRRLGGFQLTGLAEPTSNSSGNWSIEADTVRTVPLSPSPSSAPQQQ